MFFRFVYTLGQLHNETWHVGQEMPTSVWHSEDGRAQLVLCDCSDWKGSRGKLWTKKDARGQDFPTT